MTRLMTVICALGPAISTLGQVEDLTLVGQPHELFANAGGGTGIAAPQLVRMFVSTKGTSGLDHCAALLDKKGAVTSGLYVKLQNQSGNAAGFSHAAFYEGIDSRPWSGMLGGPGFFALPAQFTEGTITVYHDGAGTVTLTCPVGTFHRGGWVPQGGNNVGIAFFSNLHRIDDFGIETTLCDNFNRADGPIGSNWTLISGSLSVSGKLASGGPGAGVMTSSCPPGCTGKEQIKKAKCKNKRLKITTVGGNPGEIVTFVAPCGSSTALVKADGTAKTSLRVCNSSGSVSARWTCGAADQETYACQ